MKRCLLILLFAFSAHATTNAELQFGFPHFLALKLDRPLTDRWRVGLSAGWFPVSVLTAFYHPVVNASVSDDFDMSVDLGANAFSTGIFSQWTPGSGRSFLRFELLVNTLHAAAKTYVVNTSTQNKAPYLDIDATAILPRLVVTWGMRISKDENSSWFAGLGLTLMIPKSTLIVRGGPAAAYYAAVPTASGSVQDGITNAEAELSSILTNTLAGYAILPAFWISSAW